MQHCTDPWSPLVPDFPQDHLKSSSTNPKIFEEKKKSGVCLNGQRPFHALIRLCFSLSRESSHSFDVAEP